MVAAFLGGLLGLLNGIIYAYGAVPSFVVTLGSLSIFSGVALQILEGRSISFESEALDTIAIGQWIPPFQNIALCAIAIWGVGVLIAERTRFGRHMYLCVSAIGNQRGGGDRGCAGEPEPATKRVNQIILNS